MMNKLNHSSLERMESSFKMKMRV